MTQNELEQEIRGTIDRTIDAARAMPTAWIVQKVVENHHPPGSEVLPFDRLCAYGHVRYTVRQVVRRNRSASDDDDDAVDDFGEPRQQTLPGFTHVQKEYVINRNGEGQVVLTEEMTYAEIGTKIEEIETMGQGCFDHARELRRYRDKRFPPVELPADQGTSAS
jgi:hypothetical protein